MKISIESRASLVNVIREKWAEIRVLVLGDVMLDRYLWGSVRRVSPEAPIPVVCATNTSERPGGAANVALNIAGLGASATLVGVVGEDASAGFLKHKLQGAGVTCDLIPIGEYPTTTKLRVLCGTQQLLRIDTEETAGFPAAMYNRIMEAVRSVIDDAHAVILSDYAKGVLSEKVCQQVIGEARSRGLAVLVDPKGSNIERYRGATTICPNLSELSALLGGRRENVDEILSAAKDLVEHLGLNYLIATMSEKGIAIVQRERIFIAPASAREVFDICGAGDTVIATLAVSLASGMTAEAAVSLANLAAGTVVRKVGTVPVTRDELLMELVPNADAPPMTKIMPVERLSQQASQWRSAGQRIVLANGCFDLLHAGHVTLLQRARHENERLIVAINSDDAVRQLKGPQRPIVDERNRAHVLSALACVDAVVIFDHVSPIQLIQELRPDILVKGDEYTQDTVLGGAEMRAWGGEVRIVPNLPDCSTTALIEKARGSDWAVHAPTIA